MNRILTLTQPWATLMALGLKTIETRSWGTKYRGPLVIHAAKAWNSAAKEFASLLILEGVIPKVLPFGEILCVVNLVSVRPTEEGSLIAHSKNEHRYGDYTPGRWAWLTYDLNVANPPLPWRGGQGLRHFDIGELAGRFEAP